MRNVKNAKKKSVAVNNGHALKALAHEMWQCAAADISALKGFGDASQTRFSTVSRAKRKSAEKVSRTLDTPLAKYVTLVSQHRYSNEIVIVGSSKELRPSFISNPTSTSFTSEAEAILLSSNDDSHNLISRTAHSPSASTLL